MRLVKNTRIMRDYSEHYFDTAIVWMAGGLIQHVLYEYVDKYMRIQ